LQNEKSTKREIAESVRKNAKDIFKTIRISRNPKTSFTDTVFIVIEIAYRIEVFRNAENIKIAY